MLCFSYGERNILSNIKKSQNIMAMFVGKFSWLMWHTFFSARLISCVIILALLDTYFCFNSAFFCLSEMHHAFYLPVLFILFWVLYQWCLWLQNWKSVFLILKVFQYGGEFSFFLDIHVRIDIRIDASISIRSATTRFGQQVYKEELTQMRLNMQVLVTSLCQEH